MDAIAIVFPPGVGPGSRPSEGQRIIRNWKRVAGTRTGGASQGYGHRLPQGDGRRGRNGNRIRLACRGNQPPYAHEVDAVPEDVR